MAASWPHVPSVLDPVMFLLIDSRSPALQPHLKPSDITLVEAVHCQTQSQGVEVEGKGMASPWAGAVKEEEKVFDEQPSGMLHDCPHSPPSHPLSPL